MLLQEHFFRRALQEKSIKPDKSLKIDHTTGKNYHRDTEYPPVFPESMIDKIQQIAESTAKTRNYFFRGLFTPEKEWIHQFKDRDALIQPSGRGRDPALKYQLDLDYYREMAASRFVLCPTDIYPWSYRWFEAVMTGAIPVLDDSETDIYSEHFKFYRVSDRHVYREDWVQHNLKQLRRFHTVKQHKWQHPVWQPVFAETYANIVRKDSEFFATRNSDGLYRDVTVGYHRASPTWWQAVCAVTREHDGGNRALVIPDSNTFCTEINEWQSTNHRIYDRLTFAYHWLKNTEPDYQIEGASLLVGNAFTAVNSGHELSIILDCIDFALKHRDIQHLVFLEASHLYPNNLDLTLGLMTRLNITAKPLFIQPGHAYRFNEIYIKQPCHVDICRHRYLIEHLRTSVKLLPDLPRKILLIKCSRNQQVTRPDTAFTCERLIERLERQHGFTFINPENTDIGRLSAMLKGATHIVSSWGGILYTNMIFFNPGAKIVLIPPPKHKIHEFWDYVLGMASVVAPSRHINLDKNPKTEQEIYAKIKGYLD